MNPRGIHYLGEFIRCKADIKNVEKVVSIVETSIKETNFTLVKTFTYPFEPMGATIVSIIGESHIAVHTYPEVGHVTVDVFTCTGDPKELFWKLKEKFSPEYYKYSQFLRGYELSQVENNSIVSPSSYGIDTKYSIEKVIYSGQTKFQKVDIIENKTFGMMLFLDEDLQLSQYDIDEYNKAISTGVDDYPKDASILILGGGDGALLHYLTELGYPNVRFVDIDGEFVDLADKHMNVINHGAISRYKDKVIIGEATDFLKNSSQEYDVIISDLTIMPESFTCVERGSYFKEMFSQINDRLKPGGLFTFQCASSFDRDTILLFKEQLPKFFHKTQFSEVFMPSFGEKWVFGRAAR